MPKQIISVRSSSLVPFVVAIVIVVVLALVASAFVVVPALVVVLALACALVVVLAFACALVVVLALVVVDAVVVEDRLTGARGSAIIVGVDVVVFVELIEGPSVFFPAFNGTTVIYDPPEAGLILRIDSLVEASNLFPALETLVPWKPLEMTCEPMELTWSPSTLAWEH